MISGSLFTAEKNLLIILSGGRGGIRTHLLINHYADLSRGRFYRPLALLSQIYFNELNFVVAPVGLEPTVSTLKRRVLHHSATRPLLVLPLGIEPKPLD